MKKVTQVLYTKSYSKQYTNRVKNLSSLKIKNRKIVKQGESHFFYVPKAFFDNGQLDVDKKYDIIVLIPEENRKEESLNFGDQSINPEATI
jgi:hypothetical protein